MLTRQNARLVDTPDCIHIHKNPPLARNLEDTPWCISLSHFTLSLVECPSSHAPDCTRLRLLTVASLRVKVVTSCALSKERTLTLTSVSIELLGLYTPLFFTLNFNTLALIPIEGVARLASLLLIAYTFASIAIQA